MKTIFIGSMTLIVASLLIAPSATRDRLTDNVFIGGDDNDPVALIERALEATVAAEPIHARIRAAVKANQLDGTVAPDAAADTLAIRAVASGVRATGRLITGAALIMVVVFAGFAMGDLVMFQQMGFGLGVAVLIDATIIRSILVPASMKLLGDLNWYLPPVLHWLPRLGIEAPSDHAPSPQPTAG